MLKITTSLLLTAVFSLFLSLSAEAEAIPSSVASIPEQIELRRNEILGSADEAKVTGTCYYVSPDGDDANDGLSPDTPWKTAAKVNESELSEGDGVLFRRGDLWHGDMIVSYREGITYAAYGTGAKPAFYASPENGSGAEKWTLSMECPAARVLDSMAMAAFAGIIMFTMGATAASP